MTSTKSVGTIVIQSMAHVTLHIRFTPPNAAFSDLNYFLTPPRTNADKNAWPDFENLIYLNFSHQHCKQIPKQATLYFVVVIKVKHKPQKQIKHTLHNIFLFGEAVLSNWGSCVCNSGILNHLNLSEITFAHSPTVHACNCGSQID